MSTVKYSPVVKIDHENKFVSQFDGNSGLYIRTGVLKDTLDIHSDTGVDPFMSYFPELIDIGIMNKCVCSKVCNVDCYQKACERTGDNMSLENFKRIIKQCEKKVFQVALGGAGDPDTHENFAEILEACHQSNIVPNYTTSGIALNNKTVELSKKYCGSVAISEHFADYTDKAVEMLLFNGVRTNIHYVLGKHTIRKAIDILNGKVRYRKGINALVFLIYKPVGLGTEDKVLNPSDPEVVEFFRAVDNRKCNFKIGFDSCSSSGIANFSKNYGKESIDYCEAARFSMYIDANMNAMPCSFANQDSNWFVKLDINDNDSIKKAWDSPLFENFRNILRHKCYTCCDKSACSGGCPLINKITLCNRENRETE